MPRTKAKPPSCRASDPAHLRPQLCACTWSRFEPVEDAGDLTCDECRDTGRVLHGELGSTHSYPSRPFRFVPDIRLLTVVRGTKVETYEIAELVVDPTREEPNARGFEFAKQSTGELHHLFVVGQQIRCDCGGCTWQPTQRANFNRWLEGERRQVASRGCIHSDATALLLAAGLL